MASRYIVMSVALMALLWPMNAAQAAPRVVASIKPVQSLVAAVMTGVDTPDLLVAGGASPHTYSLKPSDAARLEQADIVFWVGPALENFLEGPLASLATKAKVVSLMTARGVVTRPARTGGLWDSDDSAANKDAASADGHIWLDPMNAKAMVAAITTTLVNADPTNAARYSLNASILATRLDGLDAEITHLVAPVKTKPFVVFHDAYQYFQARYGVNAVGSITVSPDRMAGARRIGEVKAKIASLDAVCVFAEPQFEPRIVRTLMAGSRARSGVLDPEGAARPPGPELYFVMMHAIADNLAGCLGQ